MLTKNELKYIQSLYQKKQRDQERLFVAEGPKLAEELINSEFVIRKVYAVAAWVNKHPGLQVPVTEISADELTRISSHQTPNEVVVVAGQAHHTGEPICRGNLTIVLDGIQD
ncbi:MAG: RNA methyltransferase, partial [Bacteroidota bacterium]|nr:RNA methyltransferase [Bacteroidota bacterium]